MFKNLIVIFLVRDSQFGTDGSTIKTIFGFKYKWGPPRSDFHCGPTKYKGDCDGTGSRPCCNIAIRQCGNTPKHCKSSWSWNFSTNKPAYSQMEDSLNQWDDLDEYPQSTIISDNGNNCYKDNSRRIFNYKFADSDKNTIEICKQKCANRSYRYAGVQYGNQCFCGNEVPSINLLRPSKECNTPCPGNIQQKCGGEWKLNIYDIQEEPASYKWGPVRSDNRCGSHGKYKGDCDGNGLKPCCDNSIQWCGNSDRYCFGKWSFDFRVKKTGFQSNINPLNLNYEVGKICSHDQCKDRGTFGADGKCESVCGRGGYCCRQDLVGNTCSIALIDRYAFPVMNHHICLELKGSMIWKGDESIATYAVRGDDYSTKYYPPSAMFDGDEDSFWHSRNKTDSAITITFKSNIVFLELKLLTRSDCCNERYKNVCLYADEEKLNCTGTDIPAKGSWISFGSKKIVKTTTVELAFTTGVAQIAELEIVYEKSQGLETEAPQPLGFPDSGATESELPEKFNITGKLMSEKDLKKQYKIEKKAKKRRKNKKSKKKRRKKKVKQSSKNNSS